MPEEQKIAKLKEIFADKEFVEEVLAMETAEEVQAAIKEKGVELTLEEIDQTREQLVKIAENGEEVSDEELEQVAGGFAITACLIGIAVAATGGALTCAGGLTAYIMASRRRRW
jgi:predicted ribosomally synthesized peptide with nif11-like leader